MLWVFFVNSSRTTNIFLHIDATIANSEWGNRELYYAGQSSWGYLNKIHPNPTKNTLFVEGSVHQINIFSSSGQTVLSKSNSNQIDVSRLASGIYYMQINGLPGLKRFLKI